MIIANIMMLMITNSVTCPFLDCINYVFIFDIYIVYHQARLIPKTHFQEVRAGKKN